LIIQIILGEEYKLRSSSICSILQPPVTSSLFCLNILLNILFSNTFSLCSSLNVRNQVSQQYRTTGKIIVLYILIFTFSDSRREHKHDNINRDILRRTQILNPFLFSYLLFRCFFHRPTCQVLTSCGHVSVMFLAFVRCEQKGHGGQ
jgi:hypothetical protein